MGIASSRPRDKDTRLKDRSDADDNDNDNDLDRRADFVAPNGNIYANVGSPLDPGEQRTLEQEIQRAEKALADVAEAQKEIAEIKRQVHLKSVPQNVALKAVKIATVLLGLPAIGAGIMSALFLTGAIKAATTTGPAPSGPTPPGGNNPPPPAAPGEAEYTKVVQAFAKLQESDFWPAYKTVIEQFEAGLEVQKLVAAYVVKITTPNYFADQGVSEFGTKANYQAAAKAIVAKIMDSANKDSLLAYDEVAATPKASLLLGRPSLEAQNDVVRTLRAGLLIVVLDMLMAANT